MKKIFSFLIAALFSVSMWADNEYWFHGSSAEGWPAREMTVSADGFYEYIALTAGESFKITKGESWDGNPSYGSKFLNRGFNGTDFTGYSGGVKDIHAWDGTGDENLYVEDTSDKWYVLIYKPTTTINTSENPIICASTFLPNNITMYFVNVPGWTDVKAHVYIESTPYKAWANDDEMKETGTQVNGYDVYSYTFPDKYTSIIFRGTLSETDKQTADLTWDADKPYFYPERLDGSDKYEKKWYTQANLPSERTVYFVNHKGWSFANAYAYKIGSTNDDNNKPWPGVSMTETNQTINGYNVYGVKFSSYFDAVIFNNKSGDTGEEFERVVINAATSYYYKGTLYTSIEDIPAAEIKLNAAYGEAAKAETAAFTIAPNKETASLTIVMEEVGTYNFQVKKDGLVRGKNNGGNVYNLNRGWKGVKDLGDGSDDLSLTIDKAGIYTFNYTYATDSLGVDFPALENSAVTITGTSHVAISVMGKTAVSSGDKVEELTELTISTLAGTGYRVKHLRAYKTDDETTEVAITDGKLTMPGYAITITCDEGESLANGFYLKKTTVALDDITADLKFSDADGQGERTLTTSLTEGNKFKVVEITNNAIVGWYPDGIDNDYTVDANHAGTEKIVYFRQADYDGEGWWYKHIYVPENPVDPTAIDNTEAGEKAVKRLVNGQLVIEKNGKTFNAIGAEVK